MMVRLVLGAVAAAGLGAAAGLALWAIWISDRDEQEARDEMTNCGRSE